MIKTKVSDIYTDCLIYLDGDCMGGVEAYCGSCSGSGEGMTSGTSCSSCGGSGTTFVTCADCDSYETKIPPIHDTTEEHEGNK